MLAVAADIRKGRYAETKPELSVHQLIEQAKKEPITLFTSASKWAPYYHPEGITDVMTTAVGGLDYNARWTVLSIIDDWGNHVDEYTKVMVLNSIGKSDPMFLMQDAAVLEKYVPVEILDEIMAGVATQVGIDVVESTVSKKKIKINGHKFAPGPLKQGGLDYSRLDIEERGKLGIRQDAADISDVQGFRPCILKIVSKPRG